MSHSAARTHGHSPGHDAQPVTVRDTVLRAVRLFYRGGHA